ncbi:MAG: (2Fe-2S)-binding protein [Halanaerobiaceae bacterium]
MNRIHRSHISNSPVPESIFRDIFKHITGYYRLRGHTYCTNCPEFFCLTVQ